MQKLIDNLAKQSSSDLDGMLDLRDSPAFDEAWCELYKLAPKDRGRLDTKELFLKLSEVTKGHEICSYISDDFELLHSLEQSDVDSVFLDYLKVTYEQGRVPFEWQI